MNDAEDDVTLGLQPVRFREVERARLLAALPRCRGACDQGRLLCVTPEACNPQPAPAEAATDIGAEPRGRHVRLDPMLIAVGCAFVGFVLLVAGYVVVMAWRWIFQ